jgi:hypothetical protein
MHDVRNRVCVTTPDEAYESAIWSMNIDPARTTELKVTSITHIKPKRKENEMIRMK